MPFTCVCTGRAKIAPNSEQLVWNWCAVCMGATRAVDSRRRSNASIAVSSGNGGRDTISPMMRLRLPLVMALAVLPSVAQADKPAETPEHFLARTKYEAAKAIYDEAEAKFQQSAALVDALNQAFSCALASFKRCTVPQEILKEAGCLKVDRHGKSSVIRGLPCAGLLKDAEAPVLGQMNAQLATIKTGPAVAQLAMQLKHVDECVTVYHATIDRKQSDITVREGELVKACQGMNFYPPAK